MSTRLVITNGGAAADALHGAGVADKVLSWDDVLHDGPVPGGISDADLREIRAAFLAQMSPTEAGEGKRRLLDARRRLAKRDEIVGAWEGPVLLWFEHDLYDQLQLIQILDRLDEKPDVYLVQVGNFVTHHTADDLRSAEQNRIPVGDHHYAAARTAWHAFTAEDPREVAGLSPESVVVLPFLSSALSRWLEMFPGERGLSLTESWVLDILANGPLSGVALFRECEAREDAAFRGDWSFWGLLRGLRSLVVLTDDSDPAAGRWSITELGHAVRNREIDRVDAVGIDRWMGGTHLTESRDWRVINGTAFQRREASR